MPDKDIVAKKGTRRGGHLAGRVAELLAHLHLTMPPKGSGKKQQALLAQQAALAAGLEPPPLPSAPVPAARERPTATSSVPYAPQGDYLLRYTTFNVIGFLKFVFHIRRASHSQLIPVVADPLAARTSPRRMPRTMLRATGRGDRTKRRWTSSEMASVDG